MYRNQKNLLSDAAAMVKETDFYYKTLKSKDKYIHNLEKKTNNQQDTIVLVNHHIADRTKVKVEDLVQKKCERKPEILPSSKGTSMESGCG